MEFTTNTEGNKERSKEVLDARFEFRLTMADKRKIAEKAKLAGLKPNEYVRRVALGSEVKERMPASLRRFIGGTANNLNQLTRLANAGKLSVASAAELSFIAKELLKLIQS